MSYWLFDHSIHSGSVVDFVHIRGKPWILQHFCQQNQHLFYATFANFHLPSLANIHLNTLQYPVNGLTACDTEIWVPGMPGGYVLLAVFAMSTTKEPIMASFELLFGSATLPVRVLGTNGKPAANVSVFANATTYNGVGQAGLTDAEGLITLTSVPEVTIGLIARTTDNQISINGIAGGKTAAVTLQLLPLHQPTGNATLGTGNGTSGWAGGKQVTFNTSRRRAIPWKRDSSLVLSTNGQSNVQMASNSFAIGEKTTSVYIEYLFQTDEVPGGYFGTQYNDYFSVTIRSDTGGFVSIFHSMNELGLGAFDGTGTTNWFTLKLDVTDAHFVEYDLAVANVADNLYDSAVMVRKVGGDECGECTEDCNMCPSEPKCQDNCKSPPINSCIFYRQCLEATTPCGSGEFALGKGERTCMKFQHNLDQFSDAAVQWISVSEQCIQKALTSFLDCDESCDFIRVAGFDHVARCYHEHGYCSLEAMDYAIILATVFGEGDQDYRGALKAVIAAEDGCAKKIFNKIATEIQRKVHLAAEGTDAEKNLADSAALTVAKAFHNDQLTDGDLSDIPSVIAYVQQVYDTAVAYNAEVFGIFDVNRLSFWWFRQYKYSSPAFTALQGYVNPSFIRFAKEHGLPFYNAFYYPDYPSYRVEFDHLVTSTEAVYLYGKTTPGDVGGWFGDLATFYNEWRRSGMADGYAFCLANLASAIVESTFKLEDALQDADAFNMGMNMAIKRSNLVE
ncbi:hypothetical protein ACKRZS_007451 [Fusarium odoratissimum]